jgi:hypothetical protein
VAIAKDKGAFLPIHRSIEHFEGIQANFYNKNFTLLLILARVAHLPRRVHTKLFKGKSMIFKF